MSIISQFLIIFTFFYALSEPVAIFATPSDNSRDAIGISVLKDVTRSEDFVGRPEFAQFRDSIDSSANESDLVKRRLGEAEIDIGEKNSNLFGALEPNQLDNKESQINGKEEEAVQGMPSFLEQYADISPDTEKNNRSEGEKNAIDTRNNSSGIKVNDFDKSNLSKRSQVTSDNFSSLIQLPPYLSEPEASTFLERPQSEEASEPVITYASNLRDVYPHFKVKGPKKSLVKWAAKSIDENIKKTGYMTLPPFGLSNEDGTEENSAQQKRGNEQQASYSRNRWNPEQRKTINDEIESIPGGIVQRRRLFYERNGVKSGPESVYDSGFDEDEIQQDRFLADEEELDSTSGNLSSPGDNLDEIDREDEKKIKKKMERLEKEKKLAEKKRKKEEQKVEKQRKKEERRLKKLEEREMKKKMKREKAQREREETSEDKPGKKISLLQKIKKALKKKGNNLTSKVE